MRPCRQTTIPATPAATTTAAATSGGDPTAYPHPTAGAPRAVHVAGRDLRPRRAVTRRSCQRVLEVHDRPSPAGVWSVEPRPERRQRGGRLRLHRPGPAAERVGDLLLAEVLVVAEDEHGALSRRQATGRPATSRRGPGRPRRRPPRCVGQLGAHDLAAGVRATPGVEHLVDRHLPDVRLGRLEPRDPAPAPVGLRERGLDGVLRDAEVTGRRRTPCARGVASARRRTSS